MEAPSEIPLAYNPNNFATEHELHEHVWSVLIQRYDYEDAERLYLEYFYPLD